jgi:phosphohistidine phosphatase
MSTDTYLYLIRHGEAKSNEEDPERGVTERGATNAKKAGGFLNQLQIKVTSIRHSGKKRAEQTAQILATAMGYDAPVEVCNGLNPNDDISIIKKEIKKAQQDSIIIVGHLPHLSRLASDLLTDDQNNEIIHFRNVGIVCLAGENQNWKLEWMVTPEIIGEL